MYNAKRAAFVFPAMAFFSPAMASLKLGRCDRNVFTIHLQQTLHVALPGLLAIAKFTHAATDSVIMC